MCSHNQHTKPNNLAFAIRDETTDIQGVIDTLHDIAQGNAPRASTRSRIRATRILLDRGFGKAPRRPCSNSDRPTKVDHPTPARDNPTPVGPSRSGGSTVSGTVTRLDDSLHDTLGSPPTFDDPPYFTEDHDDLKSELVSYTQEYIHTVTDDGNTLVTVLVGILYADLDDLAVKPCHRIDVAQILLDRALGVDCDPPEDPADEIPPEDIPGTPEWLESAQRELNEHIQKIMDSATEEDRRRGREATVEEIERGQSQSLQGAACRGRRPPRPHQVHPQIPRRPLTLHAVGAGFKPAQVSLNLPRSLNLIPDT